MLTDEADARTTRVGAGCVMTTAGIAAAKAPIVIAYSLLLERVIEGFRVGAVKGHSSRTAVAAQRRLTGYPERIRTAGDVRYDDGCFG